MAQPYEIEAMRRALKQGMTALGTTSPNPPVGCVVLDSNGTVRGEGHTQPPGGPHAEVMALRTAGDRARGGTAVVTLEPCTHVGRTGPCAEALLAAGVARVVYAARDHNPSAAKGHERLAGAGVDVEGGVLRTEAEQGALEAWLTMIKSDRPHVTWRFVSSLDGHITPHDVTDVPGVRSELRDLLFESDAVLVEDGADTQWLRNDNLPRERLPLVVSVHLDTAPPGARILDQNGEVNVPLLANGVTGIGVLLEELRKRDVVSVMLNSAPRLAGVLYESGMVDRVISYIAPVILAGGQHTPLHTGAVRTTRWSIDAYHHLDDTIRLTSRPRLPG